jgi:hypothetical protein
MPACPVKTCHKQLIISPPQAKYAVDEVRYVDELATVLEELAPPLLHVLTGGINTDRCASSWCLTVGCQQQIQQPFAGR